MELDDIERVLVVMAHPDDPDFSCAGTVAKWTREGKEVIYVLCTNGDKGSEDRNITPEELAETRQREQREAAARVGVEKVLFLGHHDNELFPNQELRKEITREIRRWKPDAVITNDPTTRYYDEYINHPDHRAAGDATLDAVYPTARDYLNYPDQIAAGLEPHKVREVFLSGTKNADYWVDITETIDDKIQALALHRSQIENPEELGERLKERAAETGQENGMKYAEGFKRIKLWR